MNKVEGRSALSCCYDEKLRLFNSRFVSVNLYLHRSALSLAFFSGVVVSGSLYSCICTIVRDSMIRW
jgi:hypothetical protein